MDVMFFVRLNIEKLIYMKVREGKIKPSEVEGVKMERRGKLAQYH